jgi:ADP-heptose:LPS heptosyltransferase
VNTQLPNINKIAIFRVLQLGDMMCAIPAIKALRFAYPDAEIILLGLPWARSFVERFSNYFDRFIHFPGYSGLPEQPFDEEKFELFLTEIRNEQIDLLIQMQGNGTIVNPLMFEFGASNVAGFYNQESYVDSPLFMPYPDYGSEIHRHLLLMQHLGIESLGDHLEFPLTKQDVDDFNRLSLPLNGHYICIHPGSRGSWRQWPPQYFAVIADYCADQGFIVIITGTDEEREITKEVIKRMHWSAIDLTGLTGLGAMGVLIKNAFALISNCTGVSHIADALDTPSVIISMDGEPHRWAPLNKDLHRVIDWTHQHFFETVLLETDSLIKNLLIQELNFNK